MSTDPFKQVLFNDGEGCTHTDFNNLQRYLQSLIVDGLFSSLIPQMSTATAAGPTSASDPEYGAENTPGSGFNFSAVLMARAFCLSPGEAFLRVGSANNKVQVCAGTLFQLVNATIDGNAPVFIPYRFAGTEEFTIANGDATNPRVDLLQMALTFVDNTSTNRDFEDATTRVITSTAQNIQRQVQCTLSVKQGTPAASPTIPDPDAGCCVIGSVVVGNGFTSAGSVFFADSAATNNMVIHDQRVPLVTRGFNVDPVLYKLVTAQALSNNNSSVTSSNAVNDMYVPCHSPIGRLMGVGLIRGAGQAGSTQILGYNTSNLTSTGFTNANNLAASTTIQVTYAFSQFEGAHNPSAGPTLTQSATAKIGVPIWTNGLRSPFPSNFLSAGSVPLCLSLRIQTGSNGSINGRTIFYVATGL